MSEEQIKNNVEADQQSVRKRKKLKDYIGYGGIAGIVAGAIAGYLYYYYIGCRSGSCPINTNPYFSVAWGAIIGYLLGDIFRKSSGRKHE